MKDPRIDMTLHQKLIEDLTYFVFEKHPHQIYAMMVTCERDPEVNPIAMEYLNLVRSENKNVAKVLPAGAPVN